MQLQWLAPTLSASDLSPLRFAGLLTFALATPSLPSFTFCVALSSPFCRNDPNWPSAGSIMAIHTTHFLSPALPLVHLSSNFLHLAMPSPAWLLFTSPNPQKIRRATMSSINLEHSSSNLVRKERKAWSTFPTYRGNLFKGLIILNTWLFTRHGYKKEEMHYITRVKCQLHADLLPQSSVECTFFDGYKKILQLDYVFIVHNIIKYSLCYLIPENNSFEI